MKKTLFVIAVACTLVCILFTGGCVQSTDDTLPPEVRYASQLETAVSLADVLNDRRTLLMENALSTASGIAEDPENVTHVHAELAALFQEATELRAAYFLNSTGYVCTGVPYHVEQFQGNYASSLTLSPDMGVTLQILYRHDSHSPAVPEVIIPVHAADGTYLGALVCAFDTSTGQAILEAHIPPGTNWDCWILDGDGNVLIAPQNRLIGISIWDLDAPDKAGMARAFQRVYQEKSGVVLYNTYSYTQLKLSDFVAAWDTLPLTNGSRDNLTVVIVSELTEPQESYIPIRSTNLSLEEFVYSAYRYAMEHGQAATLAELNNRSGQFTTKEYYVYAMDDEVLLAHPYLPQMIGSIADDQDENGVKVGQLLNRRAHQGGGYVLSQYPNPAANMQSQIKVNYVLPVHDSWYVCSGFYLNESGDVPVAAKESLMRYLRTVASYTASVSMEEAVRTLNDPAGPYAPGDIRFFAMDYAGTILADPQYPQYVGRNYMAMTDAYGSSLTRDLIILAKDGGGLQYAYVPLENGRGLSEIRLEYVLPVNGEWLVFASIPIGDDQIA